MLVGGRGSETGFLDIREKEEGFSKRVMSWEIHVLMCAMFFPEVSSAFLLFSAESQQ